MQQWTRRKVMGAGAAMGAAILGGSRLAFGSDAEALYEAARKEGNLNLYHGVFDQNTVEGVRAAFQEKYPGITVSLLRQPAQTIYTKLRLELQNNITECDVVQTTNILHFRELAKIGALLAHAPDGADLVPEAFRTLDPDGNFHLCALSFISLNYHSQKVTDPARSWKALLDDRWNGQITVGSPAFSGDVGSWTVAMRAIYGDDYLRDFAKQKPKVGQSSVDTVTDILAGERTIGAGAPYSYTLAQKGAGNPIDVALPEDKAVLNLGVSGVLKTGPHPNAAKLFANFLYTEEYSGVLQKNYYPTVRTDMPWADGRSLDQIEWHMNDPVTLADDLAEGIAKWKEIIG